MASPYRSTFSVVTTHLFTSGFCIPFLAGIASFAIIYFGKVQQSTAQLTIQCAAAIVSCIGGTYYSLSYLSWSTRHQNWVKCTLPSIVGFTTLAIFALVVQVAELSQRNVTSIAVLSVCYAAMWIAFARITAAGFKRMAKDEAARDDTVVAEAKPFRFTALLGVPIGFLMGFVIGMVIAGNMDGGGWNPPNGWYARLLAGVVTGGVGAFLGLFAKPSRI